MIEPNQSFVPPAGEHTTISGTDVVTDDNRDESGQDNHIAELLRASQREQIQIMTDRFEASFDRLTNLLSNVFKASGEGKRKADSASASTGSSASKSARLSHIGSAEGKHASTSVIGRDLSDSSSSIEEDSISIPDANSLDHDIADLLADQQQIDTTQQNETGDEVLAGIEAELSLTEDKGADINPKLAKITNNLFSEKLQDDKVKEKLKKHLIPSNCNNLAVAKCNPEIWGTLTHARKLQDVAMQKNLNVVSKAAAALANIGNELLLGKAGKKADMPFNSLIAMTTDALALLGHTSQELHQLRRDNIKSSLPANLKGLASNVPKASEFLFGDDLPKRIQSMKATNNALSKPAFTGTKQQSSKHYQGGKYQTKNGPKNRFTSQRGSASGKRGAYYKRQSRQQQQL